MVFAYGIDPRCVVAWAKSRAWAIVIKDNFGLGNPRVLLALPRTDLWIKAVDEEAEQSNISDISETRVTEIITVLTEVVSRCSFSYDASLTWLENAEDAHLSVGFEAIISNKNPHSNALVITCEEIGDASDARWEKERAATPRRTGADLSSAIEPLLRNCDEVHFIDPHIGFENGRYRESFEAFFNCVSDCSCVVIHCSDKATIAFFEGEASNMVSRIPAGVRVRFKRWKELNDDEVLHDRYILTDVGGVVITPGLDAGDGTANINLMTDKQYGKRLGDYCSPTPKFSLADEPDAIEGTGK